MSTVSIALLTWNRASVMIDTMARTLRNAGAKWDSLIWCDNGSEHRQYADMEHFLTSFGPVTKVRFPENTGMAMGFNSTFALARTDYIMLMAPDCVMPDNWLKTFVEYLDKLPDAGIVAMWTVKPEIVPERLRGHEPEVVSGLPVLKAMPFDIFCIRRSVLKHTGYFREDFGLYAWSDVELMHRFERVLPTIGMNCYVIPGVQVDHLGSEGASEFKNNVDGDTKDYHEWKQKEVKLESNIKLIQKCSAEGFQYYSPF